MFACYLCKKEKSLEDDYVEFIPLNDGEIIRVCQVCTIPKFDLDAPYPIQRVQIHKSKETIEKEEKEEKEMITVVEQQTQYYSTMFPRYYW